MMRTTLLSSSSSLSSFSRLSLGSKVARFASSSKEEGPDGAVVAVVEGKIGEGNEVLSSLGLSLNSLSSSSLSSRFLPFLAPKKSTEPEKEKKGKKEVTGLFKQVMVYGLEAKDPKDQPLIPGRTAFVNLLRSDALKAQPLNAREVSRLGASAAVKSLVASGAQKIEVDELLDAKGAAEGATLALYKYKTGKGTKPIVVPARSLTVDQISLWKEGEVMADAQNFARRLADTPANLMTPKIFVETVREKLRAEGVLSSQTVDDSADSLPQISSLEPFRVLAIERGPEWAKKRGMGCFLGVTRGSAEEPRFLELHYRSSSASPSSPPLVLVGKGVTFDTGGISIKPSSRMASMKGDMGGAASVVSALVGIAKLKLPVNVTVLTPLCENMPDGLATKPGDVHTAMNGKTVEVDNTDAEGRLILADALSYSGDFGPHTLIDVATLTGAIMVALGTSAVGTFSTSSRLFREMEAAGLLSGDRFWRMPLYQHFKKQINSQVADLLNVGRPEGAGSCTAASFLQEFVSCDRWMHLDIAGVMDGMEFFRNYYSKGMTGIPVRSLIEFARGVPEELVVTDATQEVVDYVFE